MANLTTPLDAIPPNSSQKEVLANALFDAASPAMAFGRKAKDCVGLNWGYYGGILHLAGSPDILTQVPANVIALTASSVNYLELNPSGVLVKNLVGFTHGWTPLYKITTGAANVTDYEDWRHYVLGTTP